jgi:hypothetical protein
MLLLKVSIASEYCVLLIKSPPAMVTVIISGKPTANERPFGGTVAGNALALALAKPTVGECYGMSTLSMARGQRHLHCRKSWPGYSPASSHHFNRDEVADLEPAFTCIGTEVSLV